VKHLPKHLRPKWRYLAVEFETIPGADFDRRAFQAALWASSRELLGDAGSAEVDCSVLRFDREGAEGVAVVRCRRDAVERTRAALACLSVAEGAPLRPAVAGVSGTVRACEEKYLSRPRGHFKERTVAFADADRRAVTRGDRVDVHVGTGVVGATNLDTDTTQ
jgi:ribonuclease P/MRP protein subunit POP5